MLTITSYRPGLQFFLLRVSVARCLSSRLSSLIAATVISLLLIPCFGMADEQISSPLKLDKTITLPFAMDRHGIQFTPDGQSIYAGSPTDVFISDIATGKTRTIDCSDNRKSLTSGIPMVSPDGQTLAVLLPDHVLLFDFSSGRKIGKFASVPGRPYIFGTLCPDGKYYLAPLNPAQTTAGKNSDAVTEPFELNRLETAFDVSTAAPLGQYSGQHLFSRDGKQFIVSTPLKIEIHEFDQMNKHVLLHPHSKNGGSLGGYEFGSSPDSSALVVDDSDGIRVWNTSTGQSMGPAFAKGLPVRAFALSVDRKKVATFEISKQKPLIRIWEVATGKQAQLAEIPAKVFSLRFSPDLSVVLTVAQVNSNEIQVWDMPGYTPPPPAAPPAAQPVTSANSPASPAQTEPEKPVDDTRKTPTKTNTKNANAIPNLTLQRKINLPDTLNTFLCMSPDGKSVLTCSTTRPRVFVSDVATGQTRSLDYGGPILQGQDVGLSMNHDGDRVIVYQPIHYKVLDFLTGKLVGNYPAPAGREDQPLAMSPDGKYEFKHHAVKPAGAEYGHVDGIELLTLNTPWDVSTEKSILTIPGKVGALFSPDCKRCAIGSLNQLEIKDVQTGDKIAVLKFVKPRDPGPRPVFSPDGSLIAKFDQAGIQIWTTTTGQLVNPGIAKGLDITGLTLSLDNSKLATVTPAAGPQVIRIWDVASGKLLGAGKLPSGQFWLSHDLSTAALLGTKQISLFQLPNSDAD